MLHFILSSIILYFTFLYFFKYRKIVNVCLSLTYSNPSYETLTRFGIIKIGKKRIFKSFDDIRTYYLTVKDENLTRVASAVRYTKVVHTATIDSHTIVVDKYFTYDGESIGFLQRWASDGSAIASLFHDYLYHTKKYSRETCDAFMVAIMRRRNVAPWRIFIVWCGLYLFGKSSYDKA